MLSDPLIELFLRDYRCRVAETRHVKFQPEATAKASLEYTQLGLYPSDGGSRVISMRIPELEKSLLVYDAV